MWIGKKKYQEIANMVNEGFKKQEAYHDNNNKAILDVGNDILDKLEQLNRRIAFIEREMQVHKFREQESWNAGTKPKKKSKDKPKSIEDSTIEKMFNEFWKAYPIKKGKAGALKKYKVLIKKNGRTLHETILQAIKLQKSDREDMNEVGAFVPQWKHPTTWLNHGCWEDETNTKPQDVVKAPLQKLTQKQKKVYDVIYEAQKSSDKGIADLSQRQISEQTGITRGGVNYICLGLAKKGIIEIDKKRKNKTGRPQNIYRIIKKGDK